MKVEAIGGVGGGVMRFNLEWEKSGRRCRKAVEFFPFWTPLAAGCPNAPEDRASTIDVRVLLPDHIGPVLQSNVTAT